MAEVTAEEKVAKVKEAMAFYFDCEPEQIGNFVFGCDRELEDGGTIFSAGWTPLAHWYILGLIGELRATLERRRVTAQREAQLQQMRQQMEEEEV